MSTSDLNTGYVPRLLKTYREEVVPQLKQKYSYANAHSVPSLMKIVISMGIGSGISDNKVIEQVCEELGLISGQKPKVCRARKPISNFKIREGLAIGCCVTLRKARMYEFLDRFISIASPRIRDFRGFSRTSFDKRGNYNFGLTEQNIFVELNLDRVARTQGMNIAIHTSAKTDGEARELLTLLGFPFRIDGV